MSSTARLIHREETVMKFRELMQQARQEGLNPTQKQRMQALHRNDTSFGKLRLDGHMLHVDGKKVSIRDLRVEVVSAKQGGGIGGAVGGAIVGTLLPGGALMTGLGALGGMAGNDTSWIVVSGPGLKKPYKAQVPASKAPEAAAFVSAVLAAQGDATSGR